MVAIVAMLLVSATVQAELQLVVNFEGLSGNPDGQACNGVLGGTLDTESEGTGNSSLPTVDGSTTMSVIGHSSGTLARAIGVGGITNTIDITETGVGFFRFMVTTGGIVRSHMGLFAEAGNNPVNGTRTQDPTTIPAGFKLVDNGTGFDMVTLDGATVLKAGLARSQWYNVWIVADNTADTFDLYLSEAEGPAGDATLPKAQDLVEAAIPFAVATDDPLNSMIFANPTSPTGSGQATRIYVDEIWWDGDQGLAKPTTAKNPSPADKAQDVPRDVILGWTPAPLAATHNVYFGTGPDDLVPAAEGQDANTFDPGLLEFGATYYWRVDEVNSPPDSTVFEGSVWSFTVEPASYPIQGVTATASSSSVQMGPEKTIDGSGLNNLDQHSMDGPQMWLSGPDEPQPAWIQYEFDAAYKLDQLLVWNSNQVLESVLGFGARSVTIEYSTDAAAWTTLGDFEFARAPGADTYAANTTVDFAGAVAKYVRLTINSNWGGVIAQYGLSEVRFFYLPVLPREPIPAVAQTDVEIDAVLNWRAGREAASHQVYFGADQQAVANGTVSVNTVTDNHFAPGALVFGTTYYWKVAEVNDVETPSVWEGDLWSFTTKEYLIVDDIESYDDDDNRIYDTWIDGFADNSSGSIIGYMEAPFAERAIVHGGKQSMPFEYNNVNPPFYSEAVREFAPVQDWTVNGADTLSLWVRGNPAAFVEDAGVITMGGAGHDIWDAADDFRFAHKSLTGNGSVVVKVESLTNTNGWAKAGVMIRQSLDADSKFVYFIVSYSNGVSLGWRPQVASTCSSVNQAGIPAPQWVKLTRAGDAFTAQYSADGNTWIDLKNADGTIATTTVAMTNPVYVGLCVTSHNRNATTTAVMSGAATTGTVSGSWQVTAIGDDPQPANAPADLYVTIQDSAGKSATAVNPTAVTSGVWTQWKIPVSGLTGVNLKAVKKMYIGAGSKTSPAKGGGGMLHIDDIAFGRPVSQ
jgi:regulation of enolase protein 1 (concanavalin A-like superfamily)